jgi:hypothetical protein
MPSDIELIRKAEKAFLAAYRAKRDSKRPFDNTTVEACLYYDAMQALNTADEQLRSKEARAAMQAAFEADPEELGKAAVEEAKKKEWEAYLEGKMYDEWDNV